MIAVLDGTQLTELTMDYGAGARAGASSHTPYPIPHTPFPIPHTPFRIPHSALSASHRRGPRFAA